MVEKTKSTCTTWRGLVRIGIGLLLFLVLLGLYHRRKQYHAYAVTNQQDMSQDSLVGYGPSQRGYLRYSEDSVSCISEKDDTYQTSSFEMKDPMIGMNRSYAVVADRSGNTLQVFDEKHGKIGECRTEQTLDSTPISLSGVIATLEEDSSASYIQFYKKDGSVLSITVRVLLGDDDYFTTLNLSDGGSQVIAGVIYLKGDKLAEEIMVYDFSDSDGSGREDQMKSGITPYEDENLISEMRYFWSGCAFAASTRGFYFSQIGKNGIERGWKLAGKQEVIHSLCFNRNYVAIILNEAEAQGSRPCRVELYNSGGDKVIHVNFNEHYTSSSVNGGTVFLTGSDALVVFSRNGTKQFSGAVDLPLVRVARPSEENRYLRLGAAHIKEVRSK